VVNTTGASSYERDWRFAPNEAFFVSGCIFLDQSLLFSCAAFFRFSGLSSKISQVNSLAKAKNV